MPNDMTFWLYRHGILLTAIRAPEGTTDQQAIARAIALHDAHPRVGLPDGMAPFEFRRLLTQATVIRDQMAPQITTTPGDLPASGAPPHRVRCVVCDFKVSPGRTYVILDGKAYHRTCANERRLDDLERVVRGAVRTLTVATAPEIVRPLGVPASDQHGA